MNFHQEIGRAFNAHAAEYEQAAKVQREIGERLFERLHYLKIKPKYVLDLGCGPGLFTQRLKAYYPNARVVGLDLAYAMLKQARQKQGWLKKWPLVNGDMLAMPFPDGLFDLVFSNQTLHWSPSLDGVLSELNRVMNQDGCCFFSTLGPDTFLELKHAWSMVDGYAHTNEFVDIHDLGDLLLAGQFLDPVVDMEKLTICYPTVHALFASLKAQGVRNMNPQRNQGLTGRSAWHSLQQKMMTFQTEQGKFPLTYEVVYAHAWKGVPPQQHQDTFISVESLRTMLRAGTN